MKKEAKGKSGCYVHFGCIKTKYLGQVVLLVRLNLSQLFLENVANNICNSFTMPLQGIQNWSYLNFGGRIFSWRFEKSTNNLCVTRNYMLACLRIPVTSIITSSCRGRIIIFPFSSFSPHISLFDKTSIHIGLSYQLW